MQKVLLAMALVAVFAARQGPPDVVALAGLADQLVNPSAPVSQHAEVIIDPPGGG